MGKEIERKFLVKLPLSEIGYYQTEISQGYLSVSPLVVVRVRISETVNDKWAVLTIKGRTEGISRSEFEYDIPVADAKELLSECKDQIIKTRYTYPSYEVGDLEWEVDVFHGKNEGLIVAEIELPSETHSFTKPDWIGEEVSHDPRYYNSNLISHPFCEWTK